MKKHAINVSYIMMGVLLAVGILVLLVGLFGFTNVENIIKNGSYKFTKEDVINASIVLCIISSVFIVGSLVSTLLSVYFINNAKTRKPLIVMGIVSICFNLIAPGILILLIKEDELAK